MRRSPYLLAIVLATSCQDYAFREVAPARTVEVPRTSRATRKPADILFVVDDSGSMADEQENLARNFRAFIEGLAGAGDYRIAIVTTDLDGETTEIEGTRAYGYFSSAHRALNTAATTGNCRAIQPAIAHGCFRGPEGKRVIESSQPEQQQIDQFVTNVRVGSCGSGLEQGLNAMVLALENTAPGRCNQGFLREDANLVVILVSDEEDCDECATRPALDTYVQRLAAFKGGDVSKVRVAAIAGAVQRGTDWGGGGCRVGADGAPDATCGASSCATRPADGSHTRCSGNGMCPANEFCDTRGTRDTGDDRCENVDLPNWDGDSAAPQRCGWCSYYDTADCCSALRGDRYVGFAKAIEAAVSQRDPGVRATGCQRAVGARVACLVDSICQREFDQTLARIASDLIVNLVYEVDPPITYPQGVVVKVGGVTLTYGADFDVIEDGKKVRLFGPKAPTGDEVVEIYYSYQE